MRKAEGTGQGNKSAVVEARAALSEADALVYQYGFPIVANRDQLIRQYEQDPDNNLSAAKRAKFDYVYDPDRFVEVRDRIARAIEGVKGLRSKSE
jgi:hypothetical protein